MTSTDSFDKMLNNLPSVQKNRMIRKALETLDEKPIARALGVASLQRANAEDVACASHRTFSARR
jgi:hypothetical protein